MKAEGTLPVIATKLCAALAFLLALLFHIRLRPSMSPLLLNGKYLCTRYSADLFLHEREGCDGRKETAAHIAGSSTQARGCLPRGPWRTVPSPSPLLSFPSSFKKPSTFRGFMEAVSIRGSQPANVKTVYLPKLFVVAVIPFHLWCPFPCNSGLVHKHTVEVWTNLVHKHIVKHIVPYRLHHKHSVS
jgi:hypothetical protein